MIKSKLLQMYEHAFNDAKNQLIEYHKKELERLEKCELKN